MNENTAKALIKFVESVEDLTDGVAIQIGSKRTGEILTACFYLKHAIKSDETIPFLN